MGRSNSQSDQLWVPIILDVNNAPPGAMWSFGLLLRPNPLVKCQITLQSKLGNHKALDKPLYCKVPGGQQTMGIRCLTTFRLHCVYSSLDLLQLHFCKQLLSLLVVSVSPFNAPWLPVSVMRPTQFHNLSLNTEFHWFINTKIGLSTGETVLLQRWKGPCLGSLACKLGYWWCLWDWCICNPTNQMTEMWWDGFETLAGSVDCWLLLCFESLSVLQFLFHCCKDGLSHSAFLNMHFTSGKHIVCNAYFVIMSNASLMRILLQTLLNSISLRACWHSHWAMCVRWLPTSWQGDVRRKLWRRKESRVHNEGSWPLVQVVE